MSSSIVQDFTVIRWMEDSLHQLVYPLLIPLFTMFHSYLAVANWRRISDKSTVSLVDTQMKGPILMDFIGKYPCNDDFPTESDFCRSGISQLICLKKPLGPSVEFLAGAGIRCRTTLGFVRHWDAVGEETKGCATLRWKNPVCLTDARYYKTT